MNLNSRAILRPVKPDRTLSPPTLMITMPGETEFTTPQAKRSKLSSSFDTPNTSSLTHSAGSSSSSFEIPPTPCLKRLGFGTGVNVMLYERSPAANGAARSPWALKKLRRKDPSGKDYVAKRLEAEADVLKKLKHPHIIGYRGFRRSEDGAIVLAVENGEQSLYDIIEDKRNTDEEEGGEDPEPPEPLPPDSILKVIRAMALALDYLHMEKKLLHGDMKSGNILIIGDFEDIKLCDFGVTVPIGPDGKVPISSQVQYIGTEPWSAIEVIEGDEVTAKTDIFALGCTIFEMLTLETPHFNKIEEPDDDDDDDPDLSVDDSAYNDALGSRPELPSYVEDYLEDPAYEKIFALFYACTSENPDERPHAKDIIDILDDQNNEARKDEK